MLNEIIDGITTALFEEFGERYHIYTEEIEQGLQEPAFFVTVVDDNHEQFLGKRYFRQNHFVIQYFPESKSIQLECNNVADRLKECLEYIYLFQDDSDEKESKPIRGTQMHSNVQSGVLNFFVDFNCFVIKTKDETAMETLSSAVNPIDERVGD